LRYAARDAATLCVGAGLLGGVIVLAAAGL